MDNEKYKKIIEKEAVATYGSNIRTELALNLLDLSKAYGKTQADLCAETGISRSGMSSYFTGARYPRPHQLEALAKCFNITVSQLIGKTPPEEERVDDLPIELRIIAREGRKLKKEQRETLLRYCMFQYPEVFDPANEEA